MTTFGHILDFLQAHRDTLMWLWSIAASLWASVFTVKHNVERKRRCRAESVIAVRDANDRNAARRMTIPPRPKPEDQDTK